MVRLAEHHGRWGLLNFIHKLDDPATLPNAQLLVAYSTTVLMLPHCKKSRKAQMEAYGKRLSEEIFRRMEGHNGNSDEIASPS